MRLASIPVRLLLAVATAAAFAAPLALRAQEHGITVYENIDFKGRNITIEGDVPDLRAFGFDRTVSSFRFPPGENWEVCTGRNFTGRCRIFSTSVTDLRRSDWNDDILSIRRAHVDHPGGDRPVFGVVPPGSLELYAGTDFSGRRVVLTRAMSDFRALNFNDRALSLRAVRGEAWEVCYNINFDDCRVVDGELPNLARYNLLGISSAPGRAGHDWNLRPARSIELYAGVDFSGEVRILTGSTNNLEHDRFNDRAESLHVPRGAAVGSVHRRRLQQLPRYRSRHPGFGGRRMLNRNISSVRPHVIR